MPAKNRLPASATGSTLAVQAGGSHRRTRLSWRVLLPVLLLLGLLVWGATRFYIQRRDRMLVDAATRAVETRDFSSARVWLQRLYLTHPNDVAAYRLIARFHATQRHPEELTWRLRVIQTGPVTLDDYLSWASAALRLGQVGVARGALARVPPAWQENAGYHELSAGVAVAAGQPQAADDHLAAAVRLDPSNPVHAINLAALRLTAATEETRQAARASLEGLATGSPPPVSAVRALLNDAVLRRDAARTTRFRSALGQHADHTLDDDLACLSATPSPEGRRVGLASLRQKVAADPIQALQVAEWMISAGDAAGALEWLRGLAAAYRSDVGLQTGQADALTALRDWSGLRALLEGKDWQGYDFMRVALLVRCDREGAASTARWPDAVSACRGNGANLFLLAQTVASWSWPAEAEALYWRVTELGYPSRGPALEALWDLNQAAANTGGLLRVAREQFRDDPKDPGTRNNFAFLSLLSGVGGPEPKRVAEENFLARPENPNVAATHAYALYLDGHYEEGLCVLNRFDGNRMQATGAALYLALLQRATGQGEAATRSAATVDPRKLLPEERLLLQKIGVKNP